MNYRIELQKMLQNMVKYRGIVSEELRAMPEGTLYIYRDAHLLKYVRDLRIKGKRVRRGITRSSELINKLARKRYLQRQAIIMDRDIKLIRKALNSIEGTEFEHVRSQMPAMFRELPVEHFYRNYGLRPCPTRDESWPFRDLRTTRSLADYDNFGCVVGKGKPAGAHITPEQWAMLPYRENTKYLETKTVLAVNGLLARSKSEADYIRLYENEDVLYHYDETFCYLDRTEYDPNGTLRYISPDFVLLRPDGTFLFHEHLGRPDDPKYMRENIEKLHAYISLGIMPGIDLMITFERPGGGIDLELSRAMLNSMLLQTAA